MGFKRQKQRLSEHAHVTSDAHGLVHRGHEEQCDMRRAEKLEILHDSEVALFSGIARVSRRLVIGCSLLLPALGVNAVGAVEIEWEIPREVLLARRFQKCGAQLVARFPGRDGKGPGLKVAVGGKIGRASWRGSGWRYCEVEGGAV